MTCRRATEGEGRLRAPKVLELNLDVLEGQPQGSHAGRLLVLPGDDVMADWDTAVCFGASMSQGVPDFSWC